MKKKNNEPTYGIEETITPIDGRNKHKLQSLAPYFSDFALNKHRVLVELKYLLALSKHKVIRKFTPSELVLIHRLINTFSRKDYFEIREIEKETNHDMKAVEEYIKEKLKKTSLKDVREMVHFGLTSDDTNNIAYALIIRDSLAKVIFPEIEEILEVVKDSAKRYKKIAMLGRTHGQTAAPTTLGKEYFVYYKRLKLEIEKLRNLEMKAKLTGNVGNLNAHKFVYPKINWLKFSEDFISSFGLTPELITTQILPYDSLIAIFNKLITINNILLGLCKDFWMYIMLGYFKQKVVKKEVGSTALPHKVNPIYFEGAEGGFDVANAFLEMYCRKLPYSRLQRDLSDSTVKRSFGTALSYCLLSYQSVNVALKRVEPHAEKLHQDLDSHWEVLSEAIQNTLRTKGYNDAYEKTKQFFRGKNRNKNEIKIFIETLKLKKSDKKKLLNLSPENYTGYAGELVEKYE
ncbi:adenylosuccinate lyase [Candidatus Roizmanbacteria bacterium RIFCSPHIGHO2_01_FULL_39_8]|uniref:Adenylosuccinate lyase n=2 Tax=Candidatus Roizmaniibacteriota TaxID=1752723 RepID=A0A1F7GP92_9BACT|nr:MAG: adenylosuccinate lyase [Candidatus Roizmanbacteria bacterium RIFCSPHIGHO2_01_FULL_39_8]OGK28040.1 MAG: adenylosuccinate lyase [Candidatus Roizmanbacteria bacterium RIFCSPHIGHO2_02_FULL_39_9]